MGLLGNFESQIASIFKKAQDNNTATNNDLNNSPRYVDINQPRAVPFSGQGGTGTPADINQPRTAQFSGANVNANTYEKNAGDFLKTLFANEGGEISKGKNGRNTVIKKFGHEGAIDPNKSQITKLLKDGGEVLARGNKLAKHRSTKLY
jgi:hypothetical protein